MKNGEQWKKENWKGKWNRRMKEDREENKCNRKYKTEWK